MINKLNIENHYKNKLKRRIVPKLSVEKLHKNLIENRYRGKVASQILQKILHSKLYSKKEDTGNRGRFHRSRSLVRSFSLCNILRLVGKTNYRAYTLCVCVSSSTRSNLVSASLAKPT